MTINLQFRTIYSTVIILISLFFTCSACKSEISVEPAQQTEEKEKDRMFGIVDKDTVVVYANKLNIVDFQVNEVSEDKDIWIHFTTSSVNDIDFTKKLFGAGKSTNDTTFQKFIKENEQKENIEVINANGRFGFKCRMIRFTDSDRIYIHLPFEVIKMLNEKRYTND